MFELRRELELDRPFFPDTAQNTKIGWRSQLGIHNAASKICTGLKTGI